jgi:hypothetical protein
VTALNSAPGRIPDITPQQHRRAGIWCAAQALQHPELDPHDTTRELLYATGLEPDPDAKIRQKYHSRLAAGQKGPGQ